MAVNDIWRIAIKGLVSGQEHVNVLHVRNLSVLTDALFASQLLDDLDTDIWPDYRALFRNEDAPRQLVTVRKVCGSLPLPTPVERTYSASDAAGTRGSKADSLVAPSFVAVTITWRTGFAGRSFRGRSFIGGAWEEDMDALHVFDSTYLSGIQGHADNWVGFVTTDYEPWVFSRTLAEGGGNCQDFGGTIVDAVARAEINTMRSRKAGHGN